MNDIVLYQFRLSHYNEKVRWALDYKGIPHLRHTLIPGFHVFTAKKLSGQTQTPILKIGDQVLIDSGNIIAELENLYPQKNLYPKDNILNNRAVEISAYFDNFAARDLRRLFWSTYIDDASLAAKLATDGFGDNTRLFWQICFFAMRPLFKKNLGISRNKVKKAKENLKVYLDKLESLIGPSGYLAGDSFSIADLTAAAVMTAVIRPPEFSYPLPEPWPEALKKLRAEISDHPATQWTLDIYRRHRGRSFGKNL